ncbi:hypothetical protein LUZ60_001257 [Juncus effusus]|nr:hypothetical protein LUZ60_001257 [Juncus effusus]
MGKCMRKCRGGAGAKGDMAVIEVTQMVGVRTRSRALKAAAMAKALVKKEAEGELEGYLELRSRRLFMAPRITRAQASSGGRKSGGSTNAASFSGRISRCSSNGSKPVEKPEEESSEQLHLRSGDTEVTNDVESSACNSECRTERRETTASSEARGETSDLESEAGQKEKTNHRSNQARNKMPLQAELDDFFFAAEKAQQDRFASKYNFDVEKEKPLEGRYDWVRLNC